MLPRRVRGEGEAALGAVLPRQHHLHRDTTPAAEAPAGTPWPGLKGSQGPPSQHSGHPRDPLLRLKGIPLNRHPGTSTTTHLPLQAPQGPPALVQRHPRDIPPWVPMHLKGSCPGEWVPRAPQAQSAFFCQHPRDTLCRTKGTPGIPSTGTECLMHPRDPPQPRMDPRYPLPWLKGTPGTPPRTVGTHAPQGPPQAHGCPTHTKALPARTHFAVGVLHLHVHAKPRGGRQERLRLLVPELRPVIPCGEGGGSDRDQRHSPGWGPPPHRRCPPPAPMTMVSSGISSIKQRFSVSPMWK